MRPALQDVSVGLARRRKWKLACAAAALPFLAIPAQAFTASFSWQGISPCQTTSPAFVIRDAPKATTNLRFVMRDQDAPGFRHGGSTIAYDGSGAIPQGAISYIGPCPPAGQKHRYVWTIEAIDAAQHVLARATAAGVYPPN
ncbi:MAG: phospholipid-binding protein [Methylobacteriaceae bacterium]|nr:phospholipid-binding protein [Methylobacteriaceae bacterium]